ncbi:uncharacterized protein Z519_10078 [Cladophialophora bantiana CBS 173.52]|uniref:Uncharacterized protein n=1 Tax=Cladophialophora bantiana (strain ATCC 10958 / CBS 173.52 / CDC B-1940 / NIH 8579) TaxID=1442370 RepID=A0A0D2HEH7_CLAB1|nr:uncharacterized protein Z519_10078 [Cladophialophora bantiana CBS 173.52]KIW89225.1 hypothetical protein Z519_10078 [Cladophialophora bantiana CBS 173.52]
MALRLSSDPSTESHQLRAKAVIASILLLSYLEVHWPTSGAWLMHLDGALRMEAIVQLATFNDATAFFLSEELFAASTWPLLTRFNSHSTFTIYDSELDGEWSLGRMHRPVSVFTAFLSILRDITRIERQYCETVNDPGNQLHLRRVFEEVQLNLTQAHKSAIDALRSKLIIHPTSHAEDMKHLIDAYFYSTKIYSYRALVHFEFDPNSLRSMRGRLLDALLAFRNPDSFAQDQPWPLFVVGVESTDDVSSQHWVEHRMNRVIQLYCSIDRPRMLCFLRAFWAQKIQRNWISFARKWTKDYFEFLVL